MTGAPIDNIYLSGGFDDAVFQSQAAFRAIMDAMAKPGTVHSFSDGTIPPKPIPPAAGAILLTLCDHDTSVWLEPSLLARPEISAWIGFQTGALIADHPSDADFALILSPDAMPDLSTFALGSAEYPETSTTLILGIDRLAGAENDNATLILEGPGIDGEARLVADPFPVTLIEALQTNRKMFPRGVDLILVTQKHVAALPRSTTVWIVEA
ncbi:MAG: phosphonate C-P lyase system protein PhnH [Pseudomonadota bacterium]